MLTLYWLPARIHYVTFGTTFRLRFPWVKLYILVSQNTLDEKERLSMTERDLKKLNRAELLELLILQMKENEKLREQNDHLTKQIEDRTIDLENAGSIAEAAIKVNGVFQAAEAASAQYLENISRLQAYVQESATRASNEASRIVNDAQAKADRMLAEAQKSADQSRAESDAYWEYIYQKAKKLRNGMNE